MFRKPFLFVSLFCLLLLAVNVGASAPRREPTVEPLAASAALGTTFTYQGQLKSGGGPVSANCGMAFRLYDAVSAGNMVGSPITTTVPISNGQFTVGLDFGAVFNGDARWLDIRVKCPSDSSYITLTPRQPLNPTPYALQVAQLTAYNPNNRGASVNLDWYNDWPRIRYGGTGTGAANGFLIQGQSDSTKMAILDNGDVGIGTASPAAQLHVVAGSTQRAIYMTGGPVITSTRLSAWNMIPSSGNATLAAMTNDWDTSSGFGLLNGNNVASPIVWMYGASNNAFMVAKKNYTGVGGDITNIGASMSSLFQVRSNGNVGIGTSTPGAKLDVVGNVRVLDANSNPVVEIGEGLDYAESFQVTQEASTLPGMVVIIDPDHPGKLKLSTEAYDSKVAGVIAGAKGLGSGVRLGPPGGDSHDEQPVALAGRVYCYVDATYGAVKPGDLVTTSPTPGYAMMVSNYTQAQGAILGKAMEPLAQGDKGMILILVTLQ